MEKLLLQADNAMYLAKQDGKNTARFFRQPISQSVGFLLMALGEIQLRGGGYLEHLILQFKQFWLDIHQLCITA